MRLIDADKIQWKSYPNDYGETNDDYVEKCDIDKMPTVDAVIVTRCEDCVHWDDNPDTYGADDGPKGKCMKSFETMRADDFCSYGERKENNHEKD